MDEPSAATGVEYIVPILGGLGREGVKAELPTLLQVSYAYISPFFAVVSLYFFSGCPRESI